jgi:hypothetical protein
LGGFGLSGLAAISFPGWWPVVLFWRVRLALAFRAVRQLSGDPERKSAPDLE